MAGFERSIEELLWGKIHRVERWHCGWVPYLRVRKQPIFLSQPGIEIHLPNIGQVLRNMQEALVITCLKKVRKELSQSRGINTRKTWSREERVHKLGGLCEILEFWVWKLLPEQRLDIDLQEVLEWSFREAG